MSTVTRLRTHRRTVLVVTLVVLLLVVLSVLSVGAARHGGDLDPENPGAYGAQAVARVLADHGVHVTVVRRAAELERTPVGGRTTVLVTSPERLGRATARALRAHSTGAAALVLAAPGRRVLRSLGLPLVVTDAATRGTTPAACQDPLLDGLEVEVGPSAGYRGTGGDPVVGCFPGAGDRPAALVARVDRAVPTYVLGGVDVLTNDRVDDADNAAVALRLLGQGDRLVWYVPDLRDVAAGDVGSVRALLPRGLVPALWLLAGAVLATMLWRGRRLGPLVVEPLPVVVKAVESTRGRGRLYARVRDRSHAAGILRAAARRRLAARLRLGTTTDLAALAAAVARATGRDPADVHDLLSGRPVPDDAALTRLAGDLAALEREVHHP